MGCEIFMSSHRATPRHATIEWLCHGRVMLVGCCNRSRLGAAMAVHSGKAKWRSTLWTSQKNQANCSRNLLLSVTLGYFSMKLISTQGSSLIATREEFENWNKENIMSFPHQSTIGNLHTWRWSKICSCLYWDMMEVKHGSANLKK